MNNLPLGIFDSGIGGLTAVKAIHDIMPNESVIYFADTKNMPYGSKDKNTILRYAKQNIKFLSSFNVKSILAACGTVSSYLKLIDRNVFGVIDPACQEASKLTSNKKIGILATETAIKSNAYKNSLNSISSDIDCYQQACPLLASMIEKGHIDSKDKDLKSILKLYVTPLINKNIDTLILGCTHYPIISDAIKEMFLKDIKIVNPSEEAAKQIQKFLEENNLKSSKPKPDRYYVSSDKKGFIKNAKLFLNTDISSRVEEI